LAVISKILVALVAIEHVYILYMEMFGWLTPRVRKTFGTTKEFAESTKTLAANQGLYNGFLAAGLFWSLVHPDLSVGRQVALFFAGCVFVAGVYGGLSVKRSILFVQGLPALAAFIAVLVLGW